jgi:hypothetical protein
MDLDMPLLYSVSTLSCKCSDFHHSLFPLSGAGACSNRWFDMDRSYQGTRGQCNVPGSQILRRSKWLGRVRLRDGLRSLICPWENENVQLFARRDSTGLRAR